jgi:hypothetical protein
MLKVHPVPECHAAARWAAAITHIIDSPIDPRTIQGWSECVAASTATLKSWCATAGMGARQSLVFGRLLRAVVLSEGGRHRPETLLDVVEPRTLQGLLDLAGFRAQRQLPTEVDEFLTSQTLVRDRDALEALQRMLFARGISTETEHTYVDGVDLAPDVSIRNT